MEIKDIINKIKDRGFFQPIQRFAYLPYSMERALQVVEAIGKERNPKFVIDQENKFVYENLIRWVHGDNEFKCLDPETKSVIPGRLSSGIYIAGNTGSGKSWALEIMSAYCLIDNIQIKIGETQRCLRWTCFRSDQICDEYIETGKTERFKNFSIIAIQDFGAEQSESLHMGNRLPVLRQILEYRGDRTDLVTLISSNLPMNHEQLKKKYEDRVVSRLAEMCNYFELRGKDRRKM